MRIVSLNCIELGVTGVRRALATPVDKDWRISVWKWGAHPMGTTALHRAVGIAEWPPA